MPPIVNLDFNLFYMPQQKHKHFTLFSQYNFKRAF